MWWGARLVQFLFEGDNSMKRDELILALRALAKKHPHSKDVGYLWKNPLNSRSTGRRWTASDLKLFRQLQLEYR